LYVKFKKNLSYVYPLPFKYCRYGGWRENSLKNVGSTIMLRRLHVKKLYI